MALFIQHPDEKNFKLYPVIHVLLFFIFLVIEKLRKHCNLLANSLKMLSKLFFLEKKFASSVELLVHLDRIKYFFGTLSLSGCTGSPNLDAKLLSNKKKKA